MESQALRLFFGYSHKDEVLRDKIDTHLKLLQRQGIIQAWCDRRITGGEEWKNEINDNLEKADVILLLISADFVASDYCFDIEMTRALEKHEEKSARVVPIILRPCDWHSAPFGRLQTLPTDGQPITQWPNQDEALSQIAQGIRKIASDLQDKSQAQPSAKRKLNSSSPTVINFYGDVYGTVGTVQGHQQIQDP